MTALNVAVLPGDNGGCGSYRLIEPAAAVASIRPEWNVRVYQPRGEIQVGLDRDGSVREIRNLDPWPDLIVMQRTGTPLLSGVARFLQERGVAVVVDFDDAMWSIDPRNVAHAAWNNPARHRGQHWKVCDLVASRADLVTVTTDGLAARYGRHYRVEVLPNRIPDRWLLDNPERPAFTRPATAGWAGYTATHPGDCGVSAPAAHIFNACHDGALAVIADASGAAAEWGIRSGDVQAIPSQVLGPDYFRAMALLDVMLVGLRDTPFNRCKSALKTLEAGAAGVPSIAAATQPHRALAREGFPVLLASGPAEWEAHALRMLDPVFREEQTLAVREAMTRYTISAQAEAWAQAWERAFERRQKAAA